MPPIRVKDSRANAVADAAYAIGAPIRIAILLALKDGEKPREKLYELTGAAPTAVGQQVKKLVQAGIVARRRDEDENIHYKIIRPPMGDFAELTSVLYDVGLIGALAPAARKKTPAATT